MCKTRSKDNAATAAAATAVAAVAADERQTGAQQPSLREAGCDVAAVVAAADARTMQQILTRDQRTTYHRLTSSTTPADSSCGSNNSAKALRQLQQPTDAAAAAAAAAGSSVSSSPSCCPLPEILGLIGDSVPWCLSSRAKHHDHDERHPHHHHHHPPTTRYFSSTATSSNRKRASISTVVDVEQQLQLQLQRTCKVRKNSCDDSEDDNIVVLNENNLLPNPYCQPPSTTYRNKSLSTFLAWLSCVCCIAGLVGLFVALSLVSVESAPTAMTLESRRLDQAPKWLNPCGFAAEEFEGDLDVVQLNDATLLGNIVMQAKTALNYAHGFRDDFIKKTFNTDYADLHLTWKDNHYDWLPGPKQIPKKLGEQLDQDYLHKLEVRMLDTALLDAYEYMQRYAVGLEQIAWDQEDYALDFRKQFKDTEYNLRSVLCELQMALAERGVTPRADVTREVMSIEFRDMSESATYRNLRDWLIFRDYMNGLEYVVQVFEHFIRCFES